MHIRLLGSSLQMSFKTTRASGDRVSLLVHTWELGGCPHSSGIYPDLIQTVEAGLRARPTFELGVDSPGATRNCSLLVRGTLMFRSFRRLPSQVETGRTCDVYNGQLVHPCRVKSFREAVSAVMDDLRPTPCP